MHSAWRSTLGGRGGEQGFLAQGQQEHVRVCQQGLAYRAVARMGDEQAGGAEQGLEFLCSQVAGQQGEAWVLHTGLCGLCGRRRASVAPANDHQGLCCWFNAKQCIDSAEYGAELWQVCWQVNENSLRMAHALRPSVRTPLLLGAWDTAPFIFILSGAWRAARP